VVLAPSNLKDNLILYLCQPTSPDPEKWPYVVISYCYCEHGRVIDSLTGWRLSLLSYLCPIISPPPPLVSKVFSVIPCSSFIFSSGCAMMYYPSCSPSARRSQPCAHNLYRTLLVKLISLYELLRLRKL